MEDRNFDLASFKRAKEVMIATSSQTYQTNSWDYWCDTARKIRAYSPEEVQRIIQSGSLVEQQRLSENYFYKDGYYKQIIIHYATLLKYVGLLIPNPATGKSLSNSYINKRYYGALDYIDKMNISALCTAWSWKALVYGSYYGLISALDKDNFVIIDLPIAYCRSRFKDQTGNDIIEFNLAYFDKISDRTARQAALAAYPKIVSKAYADWSQKRKKSTQWIFIPSNMGLCFQFFDGRPLFLSTIVKTMEYDDAIAENRKKDAEEIKKIIVQKIPHLQDGRLVFEPEEAEEMHSAAVGMLKSNPNISVLTTYADVDAIISKTQNDGVNSVLEQMEKNIYADAGVSGQVFAATGSGALGTSLDNDLAMMMYLADKFSICITTIINSVFANQNINFKYSILPVSYYNYQKYVDTSFKLVSSGYSFLLPAVAIGLSQKDLINIKDLENSVLKLSDKLIPLQTSYTQSSTASTGQVGRPTKEVLDKAEVTIDTEESRANTEGGS